MSLVDIGRAEIDSALAEFDERGRDELLATYGFGRATSYLLERAGRLYDPKAIIGVAHRFTAAGTPLVPGEFDATAALAHLRALGYRVVPFSGLWWVNQGASYREERDHGYVWAPTQTKAGFSVSHHTDVKKLRPGQLIISYADRFVRAIGVVAAEPYESPRPAGLDHDLWGDNGNLCPIDYAVLSEPIPRTDIPGRSAEVGPFDRDGNVKQGYLYRVNDAHALPLLEFLLSRVPDTLTPVITHPHMEAQPVSDQTSSRDWLTSLVAEFRSEADYPAGGRADRHDEREELAAALTQDALAQPDLPLLRRLAGPSYGSPGPQPGFNVALQTEVATHQLIEALRFLLYGAGTVEDRLDDCLSGGHKIHGADSSERRNRRLMKER